MKLYNRRVELEHESLERFRLDIGEPYTPELEKIDEQIRYYESITTHQPNNNLILYGTQEWEEAEKNKKERNDKMFRAIIEFLKIQSSYLV